jgi:hypothetical protein
MKNIFEYVLVAIIFMILGMILADNRAVINCVNDGNTRLNGTVIECQVIKKVK